MANRLKMAIHNAILHCHALHWSRRRIARELGIDRATVARHLARQQRQELLSNAAIPPTGSPEPNAASVLHSPAPEAESGAAGGLATTAPNPNAAILPSGSDPGMRAATVATGPGTTSSAEAREAAVKGRPSLCEPFRQAIVEKLAQQLSAQRIYQD